MKKIYIGLGVMFFLILSVFIYSKDSLFGVNNQLKSSLTKVSSNADYSCSTTASRRNVDLPCEVPNDNSTCEYETIDGGKVAKTCYGIVATNVYVSYSTACSMGGETTTSESSEMLEEYISQSKMCSVEFNPCDASKDPQCSINNDPEDPITDPEDGDKKINDPITDPNDCNYKWGECKLIGMWSPTGKISCKQTGELIYSPEGKTCPASAENEVFISMNLDSPSADCNNTYANDKDICNVKVGFTIDGQLKGGKEIAWKGQSSRVGAFQDGNGFLADRTVLSTQGEKALSFDSMPIAIQSNDGFTVHVTSVSPVFTSNGIITFQAGGQTQAPRLSIKNIAYNFKKPYIGLLEAKTKDDTWDGLPTLGETSDYRILPEGETEDITISEYKLDVTKNNIKTYSLQTPNTLTLSGFTALSGFTDMEKGVIFSGKILSEIYQAPGLQVQKPIISYKLSNKQVKYYLSETSDPNDNNPLIIGGGITGVRVIGGIKWDGKDEFSGQQANISNVSTTEQRTQIRKNAYEFIKAMKSGEIVNGVKYVEGDQTISGNVTGYETLVVKNGNVIISGNITSDKPLGIIALQDGYDVNNGYNEKGNVYVQGGVTQINVVIYADGGLVSIGGDGKPYQKDNNKRVSGLQTQLVMNGSLFTRNTIGGAYERGNYVLPGGSIIQDFHKAMNYDLNYIRRGNIGYDKHKEIYYEPFVIKYDPSIQSNPPKLFSN